MRLCVVLILTIAVAPAQAGIRDCGPIFARLAETLTLPLKTRLAPQLQVRGIVDRETKIWLAYRLGSPKQVVFERRALEGTVRVDGHDYNFLAELGTGREATVYLVEGSSGLRVVKAYSISEPLDVWQSRLELRTEYARKHGFSIPSVVAEDVDSRIQILEYWEGVPINDIESISAQLGLRNSTARSIKDRCLSKYLTRFGTYLVDPNNIIYSFKNKKCRVIDAM